jgi:hypothetical protein
MYAEVGRPFIPPGNGESYEQPHVIVYADIAKVRMEVQGAECNRLLADGWVLLGVYPLTTVGEMTEGESGNGQEQKQPQDIQRYVRRLVGYVVGRSREQVVSKMDIFDPQLP